MSTDADAAGVAERRRLRRRNTGITVAFAVVLCLVGVVAAVNALSDLAGTAGAEPDPTVGSTTAGASPPAPAPTAGAAPAPEPAPAASVTFSSPSGNIGCSLTPEGARCDIVSKAWDPGPPPAECVAAWGVGVQVGPQGASLVCAGDSVLGSVTQLGYGETSEVPPFRCTSTEAGVRCEDVSTGRGFALARSDYTLF